MSVDVILPTWSRPHTLGYAARAVLAQSHTELLLHVVCDGCDARSRALVAELADPRVRLHSFPKARGFGYASRNEVLRATHGRFVAYATDDDLWLPDHVERGLRALDQSGLELVAFRSVPVHPPDVIDPHFFAFDWRLGPLSVFLRNWFMGAVTCVHRRTLFGAIGLWDERLFRFGDRDFYNRARSSGCPTRYLDEVTVLRFYAQHWDDVYAKLSEPPQARYLPRVLDPGFVAALRASAAAKARPWPVRVRQLSDFTRFAVRSGPRFLRYLFERRSRRAGAAGVDSARGGS